MWRGKKRRAQKNETKNSEKWLQDVFQWQKAITRCVKCAGKNYFSSREGIHQQTSFWGPHSFVWRRSEPIKLTRSKGTMGWKRFSCTTLPSQMKQNEKHICLSPRHGSQMEWINASWDSAATLYAKGIAQWQSNKKLNKGRGKAKNRTVSDFGFGFSHFTCFKQKHRFAFLLHDEWFLDERMIYMWMGLNGLKTHPGPGRSEQFATLFPAFARINCAICRSSPIGASHRRVSSARCVTAIPLSAPAYRMTRFFGSPANKRTHRRHYLRQSAARMRCERFSLWILIKWNFVRNSNNWIGL